MRGYAQREPLVEYKLEGYNLFIEMMACIRRNTIYNCYMFKPAQVISLLPWQQHSRLLLLAAHCKRSHLLTQQLTAIAATLTSLAK